MNERFFWKLRVSSPWFQSVPRWRHPPMNEAAFFVRSLRKFMRYLHISFWIHSFNFAETFSLLMCLANVGVNQISRRKGKWGKVFYLVKGRGFINPINAAKVWTFAQLFVISSYQLFLNETRGKANSHHVKLVLIKMGKFFSWWNGSRVGFSSGWQERFSEGWSWRAASSSVLDSPRPWIFFPVLTSLGPSGPWQKRLLAKLKFRSVSAKIHFCCWDRNTFTLCRTPRPNVLHLTPTRPIDIGYTIKALQRLKSLFTLFPSFVKTIYHLLLTSSTLFSSSGLTLRKFTLSPFFFKFHLWSCKGENLSFCFHPYYKKCFRKKPFWHIK